MLMDIGEILDTEYELAKKSKIIEVPVDVNYRTNLAMFSY